jgi:hypothetical protein
MLARTIALLSLLVATPALLPQSDDTAARLARTVLEKQKSRPFWFHLRSIGFGNVPYVFDVRTGTVKYDGDGKPKPKESGCSSRGVFIPIEGAMFYTPLESCGGPVDAKTRESFEERNKEKLDKVKRRSEAEKAKIRAEEEKERKERALFWDEFIKAFHFQIVDRRPVDARPTIMLSFTPDPQYRPGGAVDTKYLPKIHGQIWVDDGDNEISRFEMEFTNDVSSGFGVLGKVSAGTSYSMDLRKQIDDRWLPTRAETVIKMRSLLVMKTNEKYTAEYSNYRKFTTDILLRVVGPEN